MVMRWVMPRSANTFLTLSRDWVEPVGLARDVLMMEPPRWWMRLTISTVSSMTCSVSPFMMYLKPWGKERTKSTNEHSTKKERERGGGGGEREEGGGGGGEEEERTRDGTRP